MAKNNELIRLAKAFRKKEDEIVPPIYASIAVGMDEQLTKLGYDDESIFNFICNVFNLSQDLWNRHANRELDILTECERITGIDVRYGMNQKQNDDWRDANG